MMIYLGTSHATPLQGPGKSAALPSIPRGRCLLLIYLGSVFWHGLKVASDAMVWAMALAAIPPSTRGEVENLFTNACLLILVARGRTGRAIDHIQ